MIPENIKTDGRTFAPKEIIRFLHCARCANRKPPNQSLEEWARLNVGLTPTGFQVWCVRCNVNVARFEVPGMLVHEQECECHGCRAKARRN